MKHRTLTRDDYRLAARAAIDQTLASVAREIIAFFRTSAKRRQCYKKPKNPEDVARWERQREKARQLHDAFEETVIEQAKKADDLRRFLRKIDEDIYRPAIRLLEAIKALDGLILSYPTEVTLRCDNLRGRITRLGDDLKTFGVAV